MGTTWNIVKFIGLPILPILLLTSCGNDSLSRKKAASAIEAKLKLPTIETADLRKKYLYLYETNRGYFPKVCFINEEWFSKFEKQLDELVSLGYINLINDEYFDDCGHLYTNVVLTESGRKFLISENDKVYKIKLCELVFGEIEGIVEYKEFSTADVDFTLNRVNFTEFGTKVEMMGYSNRINKTTINSIENFIKYDDGWRID